MALPADYQTCHVTGRWVNNDAPDYTPAVGFIRFIPNAVRIVSAGEETIVLPGEIVAELDENGEIEIDLPATNDPDITPLGFTYRVIEVVNRGTTYDIEAPHDIDIDLSTVVGVDSSDGITIMRGGPLLIAGHVDEYADLDDIDSPIPGDVWIVDDDNSVWQWSGTGWVDASALAGPEGGDGPAAADTGLLAARGPATAVPAGFIYTATDDNGGTAYVSDGTNWNPAAPSVDAVGGRMLAQVAPSTVASVTCTVASTAYRIVDLTTPSFVMPSVPVLVLCGQIRAKRSTNAATTAHMALRYSTDGWATSTVLSSMSPPAAADLVFGVVNTYDWHLAPAAIPAAPGATVEIAAFVQNSSAGAIMDVSAPGSGVDVHPHLTVIALGV